MKRILVTGGAGFIAHTFISSVLARTDWQVVCLVVGSLRGDDAFDGVGAEGWY